jgi:uncharacterized protein (UPF0332 family)
VNDVAALVAYRLGQARDSLSAARADREAGRLREAINRGYYAMFYSGLALLASRNVGTAKHDRLITTVSELFIKNGPLSKHLGRAINRAFDLRQKADYQEFFEPTVAQADEIISSAEEFLLESRRVLNTVLPPSQM